MARRSPLQPGSAAAAIPRRKASAAWRWLAAVLVLVLGGAAAWQGQRLAATLAGAWDSRHWVAVDAQLLAWQETGVGKGSISIMPSAKPLRELRARYQYHVADRPYLGERVALAPLRDNFSDLHRDRIVATLRLAESQGGRLPIWVDPDDPARAVIDRRLPVAWCVFASLVLLMPCGLATLVLVSGALAWAGRAARRDLKPLALPLWALLHALPVLPVLALAGSGDIGLVSGALLGLLTTVGLAGLFGLARQVLAAPTGPTNG